MFKIVVPLVTCQIWVYNLCQQKKKKKFKCEEKAIPTLGHLPFSNTEVEVQLVVIIEAWGHAELDILRPYIQKTFHDLSTWFDILQLEQVKLVRWRRYKIWFCAYIIKQLILVFLLESLLDVELVLLSRRTSMFKLGHYHSVS